MNFIKTLTIVMLTLISVVLFKLGYDWMTIGSGLNPMIAFPSSTFIIIITFFLPRTK